MRGQGGEEAVGRKRMLSYLAVSGCSNTSDHLDDESTHLQLYFLGIHETVPLQILTPSLTCQLQIHLREKRDEGTAVVRTISQLWTHPPQGSVNHTDGH